MAPVCTERGLVLPLFGDDEENWPNWLRIILYLLGLGWFASPPKVARFRERVGEPAEGVNFWIALKIHSEQSSGEAAGELLEKLGEHLGNPWSFQKLWGSLTPSQRHAQIVSQRGVSSEYLNETINEHCRLEGRAHALEDGRISSFRS